MKVTVYVSNLADVMHVEIDGKEVPFETVYED